MGMKMTEVLISNGSGWAWQEVPEVAVGDHVRWECIDGPVEGFVTAFIERTMFGETWTRMEIELLDGRLQELGMKPDYLKLMQFQVLASKWKNVA